MSKILIKNALIINEGKKYNSDVLIQNDAGEKYRVIEGIVTVSPSVTSM